MISSFSYSSCLIFLLFFFFFFLSHLSPLLISGEETQIPEPELGVGKIERPVVPLLTLQHQGVTSLIHYLFLLSRLHYALFSPFFPIITYVSKFFPFLFSPLFFFFSSLNFTLIFSCFVLFYFLFSASSFFNISFFALPCLILFHFKPLPILFLPCLLSCPVLSSYPLPPILLSIQIQHDGSG